MDNSREDRIRQRAYEIWFLSGRPDGRDLEHWFEAEREIEEEDVKAAAQRAKQMWTPRWSPVAAA